MNDWRVKEYRLDKERFQLSRSIPKENLKLHKFPNTDSDHMILALEAEIFAHTQPYKYHDIVEQEVTFVYNYNTGIPKTLWDWTKFFFNRYFNTTMKIEYVVMPMTTTMTKNVKVEVDINAQQLFPHIISSENPVYYRVTSPINICMEVE